jgi:hypothetical protein
MRSGPQTSDDVATAKSRVTWIAILAYAAVACLLWNMARG